MRLDSPLTFTGTRPAAPWSCEGYAIVAVRREFLYLLALLLASGVVLFYGLDTRVLWDIDEGMHAVMAQNMVLNGNWVTPVFNGEPFFDKPPLFNWLTGVSFMLFGFTEFAARLPSAAAGFGCVVLTWLIGRRIYNPMAGILAALVLATSLEFIIVGRMVQYDVPFAFFTTLSMYFFCLGIGESHRRRRYFLLFYVAAAFATLTKGPLGLFVPALAIGIYILYLRRFSFLRQLQLMPGTLIVLLIVAPWVIMMERANPGYVEYFVMKQHVANVFGAVGDLHARHPRPFYYYVPIVFAGLFPWSMILPQALRRTACGETGVTRSLSVFLAIWFVAGLVFFSLATSKLSTYVLPLFPAAALILGRYLQKLLADLDSRSHCSLLTGAGVTFLILSALAAYTTLADPWVYWEQERGLAWNKVEILSLALAAISGIVLAAVGLRNYVATVAAMTVVSPIAAFFILQSVSREAEPYNSAAEIGIEYDRLLPDGEKMVFSPRMLDSALFYTRREAIVLGPGEELASYLELDEQVFVLLSRISKSADSAFDGDYHVIYEYGNKAIVSNRPFRLTSEFPQEADRRQ